VEYVNLYLTLRLAMYVCLTIPVNAVVFLHIGVQLIAKTMKQNSESQGIRCD
jgi:hypothetical protein